MREVRGAPSAKNFGKQNEERRSRKRKKGRRWLDSNQDQSGTGDLIHLYLVS